MWEKEQPATGGAGHWWGDLTWPPSDLCQASTCLPGLDHWTVKGGFERTWVKGSFEGPTKALKLKTYLEEIVTGHSVQMLQMDKALMGRRETWQPAI